MPDARDIVERYLSALYGDDRRTARQCLADDLVFQGPAARFTRADEYLRATEHAVRAVKRLETHKIFADGDDVAVFYDLHIDHPVESITVADWFHVDGAKIATIRTILDTGPFAAPAGETAVDLVCGMTVGKAAASATRTYADQTYYFCSAGCAEAFDGNPNRFVPPAPTTGRS